MTQRFLFVMTEVSKSHVPCIHHVIPYMDSLFDALNDYASDEMLFPSFHLVAIRGQTVLQKYYGKTDQSILYLVTMHPFFHPL